MLYVHMYNVTQLGGKWSWVMNNDNGKNGNGTNANRFFKDNENLNFHNLCLCHLGLLLIQMLVQAKGQAKQILNTIPHEINTFLYDLFY